MMESITTRRHLYLRTSPSQSYRNVILGLRVVIGILAAVSLAMFMKVLYYVFDRRFPATDPIISTFPAVALSHTIVWNIACLATIWRVKPYWHAVGDAISAFLLILLGAVGFMHDDTFYLSNGKWTEYDNPGWLPVEITGAIIMIFIAIIEIAMIFISAFKLGTKTTRIYEQNEPELASATENHAENKDGQSFVHSKPSLDSMDKVAAAHVEDAKDGKYSSV